MSLPPPTKPNDTICHQTFMSVLFPPHFCPLTKNYSTLLFVSNEGEGGPGNYVASGYSVYEEENQHLQEGLRAKVSALKSVSVSRPIKIPLGGGE